MVNIRPQDPLPPIKLDDVSLPDLGGLEADLTRPPRPKALRLPPPRPAPVAAKQAPPAPVPQAKPKAPQREGIADNPVDDAIYLGKELVVGLGHLLATAGGYIANPTQYWKDLKLVFNKKHGIMGDSGSVLVDGITENYKDDEGNMALLDAFVRRPFHTAADLAGIGTGLGAGFKLMGTGVTTSGKAARLGKIAAAGKLGRVSKLAQVGEALSKVGSRLDPVTNAGRGVKALGKTAVGKKLGDWLGLGEHTKEYLRVKANETAAEEALEVESKIKLAKKHLTPQDGVALEAAVRRGAEGDFSALSPDAKKWYSAFGAVVQAQEQALEGERVGMNVARKNQANAKAAARHHWGDRYVRATEQQRKNFDLIALKKIETGEWKPTYASMLDPVGDQSLIDVLTGQYLKSRKYGRLDNRTAVGEYERDIFKVAMRQVEAYHNVMGKLRTFNRVIESLSRKGIVRAIKKGDDLPEGYAVVDLPILKRYFDIKNMAASELVARVFRHGRLSPEAVLETLDTIIGHPALRQEVAQTGTYAVPRHLARLMDMDMGPPTGLGIVYDRLMSYWKSMATVLRPAAWVATAVGNGIMDVLAGIGFDDIRRAHKLKGLFPAEVGSKIGARLTEGDNWFERLTNTAGAYYSKLDEILVRAPAFSKEVEAARRAIIADLRQTGGDFFIAREILEDPQKFAELVAAGPEALSQADRNLHRIYEETAGRIPTLSAMRREMVVRANQMRRLEAEYSRLLNEAGGVTTPRDEAILRTQIRTLEERAAEIRRTLPELAAKETAESKVALGGKHKLTNALKRAIMQQEREALRDFVEILQSIRRRGGVIAQGEANAIPRSLRARRLTQRVTPATERRAFLEREIADLRRRIADQEKYLHSFEGMGSGNRGLLDRNRAVLAERRERLLQMERELEGSSRTTGSGVQYDELAQELYDRGVIADATEDALGEYLERAIQTVRGYRAARKTLYQRAKQDASTRVRKSVQDLIRNAKEQATLRAKLHTFERQRIISEGNLAKAKSERVARVNELEDEMNALQERIARADTEFKSLMADTTQDLVLAGQVQQTVPELEKIAKWADDGIEAGNRLAGSYARMHPTERTIFRRAVPFWNYTKAMTLLLPRIPFLFGSRVFLWNRWARIMMDLRKDPSLPEWLQDYVPVGHADDGGIFFLPTRAMTPWGGVRTADAGNLSMPSIADVTSQHPLVKMYFELKGGTPEWSKRPWSPGERMTRMDTGEVYELDKAGRVKKTIAQPSAWKALWNLFPTTQLLETLLQPYVQTDEGFLLNPVPIRKPDGEPMFPIDMMERVGKVAGLGVRKINPEEEKARESARERRVIRSFREKIRRAPPDERDSMRAVLQDWLEQREMRRDQSK